jgi:hypothetical protein
MLLENSAFSCYWIKACVTLHVGNDACILDIIEHRNNEILNDHFVSEMMMSVVVDVIQLWHTETLNDRYTMLNQPQWLQVIAMFWTWNVLTYWSSNHIKSSNRPRERGRNANRLSYRTKPRCRQLCDPRLLASQNKVMWFRMSSPWIGIDSWMVILCFMNRVFYHQFKLKPTNAQVGFNVNSWMVSLPSVDAPMDQRNVYRTREEFNNFNIQLYSPGWALAYSSICLHSCLFLDFSSHLVTLIMCKSFTSSNHLSLGLLVGSWLAFITIGITVCQELRYQDEETCLFPTPIYSGAIWWS